MVLDSTFCILLAHNFMVTLASTLPSQATVRRLAFSQCKERVAVDIAIALGVMAMPWGFFLVTFVYLTWLMYSTH